MVEWHIKLIFRLLTSTNFDLDEVDKTIFQLLPWHFQIIFILFASPKCDYIEIDKAMFQVVARL